MEKIDETQQLLQSLPKASNWDGTKLCNYKGYWCRETAFPAVIMCRKLFKPQDTDILLATLPKSGTTWLKALVFSIINRRKHSIAQSPLLTSNPHALVPWLEYQIYGKDEIPDIDSIPSPRIFATHVHSTILPDSIWEYSNCKIIYICRNPLDQFVSHRFFLIKAASEDSTFLPLEESFDEFCQGIHPQGPFWDHMLGYWNASLKNPEKVLFLKYEDLKVDVDSYVRKIAEFVGFPFSEEEESKGVVGEIAKLCSFENLKNLEVNKSGQIHPWYKNDAYFRKGEVGDWKNHLTPEMAQRLAKLMEEKFGGIWFDIW